MTGRPACSGVELGDRDEEGRHAEPDQRAPVELREAEGVVLEGEHDRNEADRREHGRNENGLVERVDDRAAAPEAREEGADHRRDDGDAADGERQEYEIGRRELQRAEEHDRDRSHRIRFEQVGRHSRTVADVVADVVGDDRGIAWIVLGNSGLDLPDEIRAHVGCFGEDAATEAREDGDERATEGQADQATGRLLGGVVEPARQDPVVGRNAEEAKADDEQARHRPGAKRHLQGRLDASLRRFSCADIGANRDVHSCKAGGRGENRADEEAERSSPAEVVPEADAEEENDGHSGDRRVLAAQVCSRSQLYRSGDLLHPARPCGEPHEPVGKAEREPDRKRGAQQREENGVILEEAGHSRAFRACTNGAPTTLREVREHRSKGREAPAGSSITNW